jgi:hypothetical protein
MRKPPGATCPRIDRVQRALRRLAWRVRNRPGAQDVDELLRQALADLELVREENRQMRAAYYAMKAKLKERAGSPPTDVDGGSQDLPWNRGSE